MLDSLFDKVTGLQWLQHRCFLVNISNFLRKTFFIEHLGWLLLFLLEREEEESVDQKKNFSNERRK